MPHNPRLKAKLPTPQEIKAEQQRLAEQDRQAVQAQLPVTAPRTAVATPDTRTAIQQYQDEDGTSMMPGRPIRFDGKDGRFYFADVGDGANSVADTIDWIALVDQTVIGRIKFNGAGEQPEVMQGPVYDGYKRPPRDTLPDRDETQWPLYDGEREDPWKDQSCLVLQRGDTGELACFSTLSKTGRNAVAALTKHYDRLQKTHPYMYPVVRCKLGGYQGKKGWVHVPVLAVVGRHLKDSAAKPDSSPAADFDDAVPY